MKNRKNCRKNKNINLFKAFVPQLICIAEKYLKTNGLVPAGTKTAIEIDRVLRKLIKNYRASTRKCLAGMNYIKEKEKISGNQNLYDGDYAPIDLITVTSGDLTLTFPLMAIFYVLWKIEIFAGVSTKKRHKFVIPPKGHCVSKGIIEFLDKKSMRILARLEQSYNGIANLDSLNGTIRFKNDIMEHDLILEDCAINLDTDTELNIPLDMLGKLYGKCDIKVYKDNKSGKSYLVFQNSAGDIISNYKFEAVPIKITEKLTCDLQKMVKWINGMANHTASKPQFTKTSLF